MCKHRRYAAVALLLAVALAGCGGSQAPGNSSVKAPVIAETEKEAPTGGTPTTPAAEPQGPVPLAPSTTPAQPATNPAPPAQPANPGTNPTQVAPAPPGNQALSFTTLQKGAYSGVAERKVVLVTDAAAWQSNWQQISSRQVPAPGAPTLDFAGQSVVIAALGEQNTGGYSVEITGVELAGGKLKVTVRETKPGPGQMVTMALTQPYHVVRIPKVPAGTPVEVVWQ